jgi:ABC-type phosphate/phosphonate transport system ATPase subunit
MPIKNHYLSKEVQNRLPKYKDNQEEFTGMKLRERVSICGASGTGKTNCLIKYIDETCKSAKGSYKYIYLCRKVEEPLYKNLINKLKKKNQIKK